MGTLSIDNFNAGIDTRRSSTTAPAGTLRMLRNAFVNSGGEIEKRKTFTSLGALPPGQTHGLAFRKNKLLVFGQFDPTAVGTLPPNVEYVYLVPTDSANLVRITDAMLFDGAVYAVGLFDDGTYRHYLDGTRLPDSEVAGDVVRVFKKKLYALDGRTLRFSGVSDGTNWTTATGAGAMDLSAEDGSSSGLVGLERYYNSAALFSHNQVQLWHLDNDPLRNELTQTLTNIGLAAPGAIAGFGEGDLLFLADTGVRSLRARDSSNSAAVDDVGSAVDNLVRARRAIVTPDELAKIKATVDPLTGHFWLTWGSEIFVLSHHPRSKITAWSLYDVGQPLDYVVKGNSRLAVRSGDELFLYGSDAGEGNPFHPSSPAGVDPAVYDASPVEVRTPFMDVGKPSADKLWRSIDVGCEGEWSVYVNPDPYREDDPDAWQLIGNLTGATWRAGQLPLGYTSQHIAIKFVNEAPGPALLTGLVLHFDDGRDG